MEITYRKSNNQELFESLENNELLNMEKCQNYIPLYNKFFGLNKNNFNSINLNNKFSLKKITSKISENKYKGLLENEDNTCIENEIFFKLSPILDPYKYLAGKYEDNSLNLFDMPDLNETCHAKIVDNNNASYVDSFFTYLTSQLLNRKDFIHGLDFYGSFLGIKNKYHVNICDDIDMLMNSSFFYRKNKTIYNFINSDHELLFNDNSRSNKIRLKLGDDISNLDILNISHINNEVSEETLNNDDNNLENEIIFENKIVDDNKSDTSEVSSRSSNTDNESENNNSNNDDNDDDADDESSSSSEDVEDIMVSIDKFPIQVIALENCESTLDSLMVDDQINNEELGCIIIQILMILITYQKLFNLTHNDLHTNNIMYIKTEKKYLYYKYNNKHYKVKTFGKIFKIIDFGRAIYNYKNKIICSDSFHPDGDAATQYNCEPYYNNKKQIIEPNLSFDLCRLGCSMYDFIIDNYESHDSKMAPIHKIIRDWCIDDFNRNILYKNNDEERYPDFKLYKMIARKVHNHTPDKVICKSYFERFIVPKKEIKKGSVIMNIDTIEI